MKVYTEELVVSERDMNLAGLSGPRDYWTHTLGQKLPKHSRPIRFVITQTRAGAYRCELDIMVPEKGDDPLPAREGIFDYRKRTHEDTGKFTAVLLIPTGIGAEIGGDCGDGNAVARLVAGACDTLITHPNVVNASDLNEMKENTLYVEGSIITRLLSGHVGIQPVRSNRVLMLMDKHDEKFFNDEVVNAVSSARITLGLDCDVREMAEPVESISRYTASGRATGEIHALERLFDEIQLYRDSYDAIALSTFIKVPAHFHAKYFSTKNMVNPWGGIEAMLTHSVTEMFDMPCAHSPMMTSSDVLNLMVGIVDPRKAPETSSTTYLHCILKGLQRSPRIVSPAGGIALEQVSCVIIPDGCIGLPTLACLENDIPLIAVRENKNRMRNNLQKLPFKPGKLFIVDNYLEAIGIMTAIKAGVTPSTVRRPLARTKILSTKAPAARVAVELSEKRPHYGNGSLRKPMSRSAR
mgnify:FL=1